MSVPMREFKFHAEIRSFEKATQKGKDGLIIQGYASTPDIDRQGEIVRPTAFEDSLKDFMKNAVVTYMHNWANPIGTALEAKIDEGGLWIKAFISNANPTIIKLIEDGVLRALSIGYEVVEGDERGGVFVITKLKLYEIAVVSIPANQNCLFSLAKALEKGTDLVCNDCSKCGGSDPGKSEAEIRKEIEEKTRKQASEREMLENIGIAMHQIGELAQRENELLYEIDYILEEVTALAQADAI